MQQKRAYWRKLDNAANMYSATSNRNVTRVFRFYCELKEEIDPILLQKALDQTIQTFPIFLSVMRKGLFWHYLEKSSLRPKVREEYKSPCSNLYVHDRKSLLFEVTYYQKRINFEVFHALTDGTGATEFLRELVKNYLCLSHSLENVSLQKEHVTIQDQECDGFSKYYKKTKQEDMRKEKAFQLKKPKKKIAGLQIHESTVSVKKVLEKAHEKQVSMTVYLSAVFLMALFKEMSREQTKYPVVLMVPVNLRNFFESDSMLNFFSYITPGYRFDQNESNFDAVLQVVDAYFKTELTKEKLSEQINQQVHLEKHPLLRLVPLEVKNLGIKAGSRYAEKDVTAIFSNMSIVNMPASYVPYIERFGVYTNTPKLELTMCSFQDTLSLSFTSRFDTLNIQRNFFQILKEQGIPHQPVEPCFPEVEDEQARDGFLFKIYSFVCLAFVVASLALHFCFDPATNWTLAFMAAIVSIWLVMYVAYKKRYNLLKNAMWQLILLTIGAILWDHYTGWRGWSLDFFLPVLCMAVLLFMFVVSLLQKDTPREYMIYFVMESVFGIVVPLILLAFKFVQWRILSILCVAVHFVFLAALVMFKGKEFKEEMNKKFHI